MSTYKSMRIYGVCSYVNTNAQNRSSCRLTFKALATIRLYAKLIAKRSLFAKLFCKVLFLYFRNIKN